MGGVSKGYTLGCEPHMVFCVYKTQKEDIKMPSYLVLRLRLVMPRPVRILTPIAASAIELLSPVLVLDLQNAPN